MLSQEHWLFPLPKGDFNVYTDLLTLLFATSFEDAFFEFYGPVHIG